MATDIRATYLPVHVYGRFSRDDDECDVLSRLSGNPDGVGISHIPYVYCMSQHQLKRSTLSLYHLKLTIRWPSNGSIIDETQAGDKKIENYDDYSRRGYVGVLRDFQESKKYVVFRPRDLIVRVVDTDTDKILYENETLTRGNIKCEAI